MRVQFVGHDASRTGAPLALASALRWLVANTDVSPSLVLLEGGPLVPTYRSLVPTVLVSSRTCRNALAAVRSVGLPVRTIAPVVGASVRRLGHPNVVVANSMASLEVASQLVRRVQHGRPRLVCVVHELDGVASRVLPAEPLRRRRLMDSVDRFVAVGTAVAEMLVHRCGVSVDRVAVISGWTEPVGRTSDGAVPGRNVIGVDPVRPLVLGIGAMHRRKGPERFVDLMQLLMGHPSRPQGRWLGGVAESSVWRETIADVGRLSDPTAVGLIATVADPRACIAAADMVVSTAIEDPFPLAALEAGALGVPVVGFDSGGLREVLVSCGHGDSLVPVGDLVGLATVCRRLLDDPTDRVRRGGQLAGAVSGSYMVDQVVPRLWAAIAR